MLTDATVERPAGFDQYDNPVGPFATHTVSDCWPAPAGSFTESHGLEGTVEWEIDLFGPYDADIAVHDVVTLPGDTTRYQVHGKPVRWSGPDGWQPGTVARLKAIS